MKESKISTTGTDTLTSQIYTHDIAARIIENFESVLDEQDVTLTSPEDDDKEPDNPARLYGSTYSDLLDAVESIVIQTLEQAGVNHDKYITDQFSGNY